MFAEVDGEVGDVYRLSISDVFWRWVMFFAKRQLFWRSRRVMVVALYHVPEMWLVIAWRLQRQ